MQHWWGCKTVDVLTIVTREVWVEIIPHILESVFSNDKLHLQPVSKFNLVARFWQSALCEVTKGRPTPPMSVTTPVSAPWGRRLFVSFQTCGKPNKVVIFSGLTFKFWFWFIFCCFRSVSGEKWKNKNLSHTWPQGTWGQTKGGCFLPLVPTFTGFQVATKFKSK